MKNSVKKQISSKPFITIIIWLTIIFLFSHQPAEQSSQVSGTFVESIKPYAPSFTQDILTFIVRKSAHFFLYGVLGILLYRLFSNIYTVRSKVIGYSLLFAGVYAITDEYHQTFVAGRSGEARDVLIDTAGALFGIGIYIGIRKVRSKLSHKKHSEKKINDDKSLLQKSVFYGRIVLVTSTIFSIIQILSTDYLPTNLKTIAALMLLVPTGAILFLNKYTVLNNTKLKQALTLLLLASMSILLLTGTAFLNNTSSVISTIQSADFEEQSYSIVTLRSNKDSSKPSNGLFGYITEEANNALIVDALSKKKISSLQTYSDITNLSVALTNGKINGMVVREAFMQLLAENYTSFYDSVATIDTVTVKVKKSVVPQPDVTAPFIMYISGIDTYGDVSKVSRSDVNILVVVNPITNRVLLVNTPRDYYVQLHGIPSKKDKLTHAGIYGIDMSRNTLQDLYKAPIDFYVRINFNSLIKFVDELGGVTVDSDYSFKSGTYSFEQGANELDGDAALAFSRTRYGLEGGDRTRGKNQQKVIEAIIEKAIKPTVIVKNQALLNAIETTIQTDATDTVINQILKKQLETIGKWQIESISVTGSDKKATTYSMGNIPLYVMEPDAVSLNEAQVKIQTYLNAR